MISTITPLRISFFGGGTDLPYYYKKFEGSTISCSINKYVYIDLDIQNTYFHRINGVNYNLEEIENPLVRAFISYFKISGLILNHYSDINDIGTGLGSSSSFVVGLVKAYSELKGLSFSPDTVANIAFEIEKTVSQDNLGKQDHYIASFGGIKQFIYHKNEDVSCIDLNEYKSFVEELSDNLFICSSNTKRNSIDIIKKQVSSTKSNSYSGLHELKEIVNTSKKHIIESNLEKFASLMLKSWEVKKNLHPNILPDHMKLLYDKLKLLNPKAIKLNGAGGGGYFTLISPNSFKQSEKINLIKVNVDLKGSVVIDGNIVPK